MITPEILGLTVSLDKQIEQIIDKSIKNRYHELKQSNSAIKGFSVRINLPSVSLTEVKSVMSYQQVPDYLTKVNKN